ncbi:hypothetical protein T439DRAFT_324031 [Meredithblackwellia eburnea MCA 4105]
MDWSSIVPPFESRASIPPFYASLPTLILVFLSLVPPSRVLAFAVLPPLIFSALYVPLAFTTGNVGGDYGIGCQGIFYLLTWLDRFVLTPNYDQVFVRNGEDKVPSVASFGRLVYALKLNMTMRGAGWKWQPRNIPAPPQLGRAAFILSRLGRALAIYLALDCVSTYQQSRPYFHRQVALFDLPFEERFINMFSGALAGLGAIALLYDLTCVACVASFIWSPAECPNMYGPVRYACTLRGFWGHFWHQSFRKCFSTAATKFCLLFSIPPNSALGILVSTIVAFTLSAIQHAYGMVAMHRTGRGSALFFMLQPSGLFLESAVIWWAGQVGIGKRREGSGSGGNWRPFGFAWTLTWLTLTCAPFFDELVQGGMWSIDPAPISLAKPILKALGIKYTIS